MKSLSESFAEGKILLINKPYEWTSFDVVHKIRRTLQKKFGLKLKVGHGGTLDPLATGLLIVCTGKATKQLTAITAFDKEYTGTFYIGATTPSYDRETEIDKTFPAQNITEAMLHETTKSFIGNVKQTPPAFSAVKIGGKPSYKKARKGHAVELQSRDVRIDTFELTEIELPLVKFRVRCSKGVYIRSLAHDFGAALQSGAHLYDLCRTRIGDYRLEDAMELNDFITSLNPDN